MQTSHTTTYATISICTKKNQYSHNFDSQLRFIFKNTYQFFDIKSCLYLLLFDIIDAFSPSSQFSGSSIAFLSDLLHKSSHVGTQNRTANRCIQRVHVTIELFTQLTLYLSAPLAFFFRIRDTWIKLTTRTSATLMHILLSRIITSNENF